MRSVGHTFWLLLAGCATTGPALSQGDPEAPPSLSVLPDMAEDASGNTDRTNQAMLVARKVLDDTVPSPPADRSHRVLQAWIDSQVVPWLEARTRSVEDARYLFTYGEPGPGEGIVTHAVIGLLHEDTAVTLEQLPMPSELDAAPEVAARFREILRRQARPFVHSALIEFRDCADEAFRGPQDMAHWAHFCEARFYRLRADTTRPSDRPKVGVSTPGS